MSQATDRGPEAGLGAIGREVAEDALRLVRAEIDLAKAQLKAAVLRLIVAIVLFVAALTFFFVGIIEALSAVPVHYSQPLFGNTWLGWVVFGGLFFVLALALGLIGTMAVLRSFKRGKETVTAFKEDAEWARGLTKRGNSGS